MNSDVPPISESDNSNPKPNQSANQPPDRQLEELEVESTSEAITDMWLEDDDDIVDVELSVQSEAELEASESESTDSTATEPDSPEVPEGKDFTPVETSTEENTAELEETNIEEATESELFVDSWLDEAKSDLTPTDDTDEKTPEIAQDDEIRQLEKQKATLQSEIAALKSQKEQMLLAQVREVQENMGRMVEEGTRELKERKTALQIEIEKLERRKERINQEMRANFAGSSQELAVKVQGFKDYLVGSLQDLARAAEKLELAKTQPAPAPRMRERVRSRDESDSIRRDERDRGRRTRRERDRDSGVTSQAPQAQFSEPTFADRGKRIRQLIDKYRNSPDYYGAPWQLRRTFEPIHAKKVQEWFFTQGGRGAVDSMGSRLQNILVASAAISILHNLYGDRCRVLVLTDTPENLGEWRRGLQDCLGISRSNFGSNRGVTLFDAPEVVVQRAERLLEDKLLPMIVIDETEELLNLSVLKFPLWLAFASTTRSTASNYLY